jgi:hypothetical protein
MQDLRRFAALRRRLNALQQESYTVNRIMENTDWRGDHAAEVHANTMRLTSLDDEIADIEYLLEYYERSMTQAQALVVTPQTVVLITAIVMAIFVFMTVAAGVLAGAINVR